MISTCTVLSTIKIFDCFQSNWFNFSELIESKSNWNSTNRTITTNRYHVIYWYREWLVISHQTLTHHYCLAVEPASHYSICHSSFPWGWLIYVVDEYLHSFSCIWKVIVIILFDGLWLSEKLTIFTALVSTRQKHQLSSLLRCLYVSVFRCVCLSVCLSVYKCVWWTGGHV